MPSSPHHGRSASEHQLANLHLPSTSAFHPTASTSSLASDLPSDEELEFAPLGQSVVEEEEEQERELAIRALEAIRTPDLELPEGPKDTYEALDALASPHNPYFAAATMYSSSPSYGRTFSSNSTSSTGTGASTPSTTSSHSSFTSSTNSYTPFTPPASSHGSRSSSSNPSSKVSPQFGPITMSPLLRSGFTLGEGGALFKDEGQVGRLEGIEGVPLKARTNSFAF